MENQLPFDINSLTPEQKAIVMEQLMQAGGQPQQQQGNFATNLFQRRILQPLQVRLGMRDSPQDILRRQESVLTPTPDLHGLGHHFQRTSSNKPHKCSPIGNHFTSAKLYYSVE